MIEQTARRRSCRILVLLIPLCLVTSGCVGLQPLQPPAVAMLAERAVEQAAQGNHAQAATLYRQAAEAATEPDQSRYYLRAAEAAVAAGDTELANAMLAKPSRNALSSDDRAALKLAMLRIETAGMTPEQALKWIEPPGPSATRALAAGTWGLRAELLFAADRPIAAIAALAQRDVWLLSPKATRANDFRIWEALQAAPQLVADRQSLTRTDDSSVRGWLQLAAIAQQDWPDQAARKNALGAWEQRYPGHPATRHVLPEQFDYKPTLSSTFSSIFGLGPSAEVIGLALPMSGDYAEAAALVRDGFLAGYYQQPEPRPNLRLFDTTAVADKRDLLQKAQNQGVSVLVGPLARENVTALLQRAAPPMPVLALNYSDIENRFRGFYQFGLAPEDEARSAARRAVAEGWQRTLALVPDSDWGSRVLTAFRNEMAAAGGTLVDAARFDTTQQDHAAAIKRVLRFRQGGDGEQSRRREDVDAIFLAARPGEARLLRTQLRFFRASDLPVLATSHVYTGDTNAARDSDLNGIMFSDMPWRLSNSSAQARRRQLESQWPYAAKRNPRLFAMGLDAWQLARRIRAGDLRPGALFAGATGHLFLAPNGQVRRRLEWAKFVKGRPQSLPRRDTIVLPGRGQPATATPTAAQPARQRFDSGSQ